METARILVIAGSDSGGGAGIQADIKTITMLGGHAMTAITAITAQNTLGVQDVFPLSAELVEAQISSVMHDIGVDAIKIGMLAREETVSAVGDILLGVPNNIPIVIDPVMFATSGDALNEQGTAHALKQLLKYATLVTPNLPELEALGGEGALGCPTLIKGGHADGDVIVDRLIDNGREIARWSDARIGTTSTHGTGCTLATAIATGLGQGLALTEAIERARLFVRLALYDAPGLGRGHGPMGHQSVREDAMTLGCALNQATVPASDYAASVDFYRTLGLRQIVDSPDNGYARFEAGNGATFSIHAGADATVYFETPRLNAWVADLKAAGLTFDQEPRDEDWLWREARLKDPAGNEVCLYAAGESRRYPPWRVT